MVTLASAQHDRLLAAAARAGCVCLFLGLESFSPESLGLANKAFNIVDRYADGIERIHRHGITVQAGIVFGFDGDDETTFESTLRQATRMGIDGATVSILTPLPKTPLYEELQRDGRLLTNDWSYYNGKTAVAFQPARMSPETLWNGYMWFRRRFFSPACILQRVRRSGVRPATNRGIEPGVLARDQQPDSRPPDPRKGLPGRRGALAGQPRAFDLLPLLKPLGDLGNYRFADWRNRAVTLAHALCVAKSKRKNRVAAPDQEILSEVLSFTNP